MEGGREDRLARETAPTVLRAIAPEGAPSALRLAGVLALAIAGAAGAVLLMTVVPYEDDANVARMKDTAQWIAWVLILAVQTAVWAALLLGVAGAKRRCVAGWSAGQALQITVIVALLVLPFLAPRIFGVRHDVQDVLRSRMNAFAIVAVVVGLVGTIAIVRSHEEIRVLGDSLGGGADPPKEELIEVKGAPRFAFFSERFALFGAESITRVPASTRDAEREQADQFEQEVSQYLDLRGRIRFLGGALAAIVALAILATGGQRSTVVAMETALAAEATSWAGVLAPIAGDAEEKTLRPANPDFCDEPDEEAARGDDRPRKEDCLIAAAQATARANRFGIEAVWSFGLFYTFALAMVYLPPYLSLIQVGRRIRDRHFPPILPNDPSYEAVKKTRSDMNEILKLDTPAVESLRAATILLVPLVTSLASSLLGGVKVGE